jgi:murein DD-endopeptidase MepM/ murein hydrolase activator NlpD
VRATLTACAFLLLGPLLGPLLGIGAAAADEPAALDRTPIQGGLVIGRVAPGAAVALDGRKLRVDPDGRFVIGFNRDQKPEATLVVTMPGGARLAQKLAIGQRHYDVQKIDGLPPAQVTPPPEAMERIKREIALVAAAKAEDSDATWFAEPFAWPAEGIISGVYGSQRILNGNARTPHYGVDVAAPTGTPVRAPVGGRVALAEPDLYFTGGTIILDHGHGVTTTYAHLSKVEVRVGQVVAQGEQIGRIGATGRVTGPHLHWAMNWFDRPLDAGRMVGPMPQPTLPAPPSAAPASTPAK